MWLIIHVRLGPGGRWRLKVKPRFVLVRSKPSSPSLVSVTLPKKVGRVSVSNYKIILSCEVLKIVRDDSTNRQKKQNDLKTIKDVI